MLQQTIRLTEDTPLTEDLCEFVGAVIGDGCIDGYVNERGKSKYHVFITGNAELDKDYLTNRLTKILESAFLKTPTILLRDSRTMILNICSKRIFKFLTERLGFIPGNKTYTVSIPSEIINGDEHLVFATIRGIFDTDGNFFIDNRKIYRKPYPRITLRIASEPLFLQLKEILEKHFSVFAAKKKNGPFQIYEIVVYNEAQLDKWMSIIGFSNQKHLRKIDAYRQLISSKAPGGS